MLITTPLKTSFLERLTAQEPLVTDGSMAAELAVRGFTDFPPCLYNSKQSVLIEDIHRAFAMAAHTLAFPQRSAIWGLTFMLALASPGFAQQDLRSTFPGRRIGGATRGACSSRLIVHLSPASSVMAPGNAGLGLLLGPSATPVPVAVTLRPLGRGGQPDHQSQPLLQRTLPAAPAGITLLALPPLQGPTVWESAPEIGRAHA